MCVCVCVRAVKYFSPTTNLCIVRVAREPYRIAWAAATLLSSIEGRPCIPNVVHVSGARLSFVFDFAVFFLTVRRHH